MNHKAIVAEITQVIPIAGADKIHLAKVLGENVIVSKEWGVGFTGVLFPVDVQLSEEFCHHNNLFRDSEKNLDKEKKGFFEGSRRVRAQPFLKVKSEGFFAALDCLAYTGHNQHFKAGDSFDELNGQKVCQKYISESARISKGNNATKAAKKNYAPFFAKHVDSEQFKHYAQNIPVGSLLSFHAKVHGTSARMSYTKVMQELPRWKQFVNKITKKEIFPEFEWDYVVGTRNVVIKNDNSDKIGFHGSEQYRFDVMESIKPFLTKGMSVYGEIAGYANGSPIMPRHSVKELKDKAFTKKYGDTITYSYGRSEAQYRFHVYRISYMLQDGSSVDMTQRQLEQWCDERNILRTFDAHPQIIFDGDVDKLRELVDNLTERRELLTEDYIDPSHVSEGIIIRVDNDGLTPDFYKSKSYAFRCMEGLETAVNIEDIS
jgi:hypothetical protein